MPIRSHAAACLLTTLFATSIAAQEQSSIPGIGPNGKIRQVATGFQFTEGPAADAEGNVYFSDLRTERLYRVDTNDELSTVLEDSRRTNGLMFDRAGRLLACESGDDQQVGVARIVAIDLATKEFSPLVPGYGGKPFNRCNDLVIDRQGGVYFTDIMQGDPKLPQETAGVYYWDGKEKVSRPIEDLDRPNGVILSPDEKTLYVLPSGAPVVMKYPLWRPGLLGKGSVFCKLPTPDDGKPRGGDGLTVDTKGNLYVTAPAAKVVQVVGPTGNILGTIEFPEGPSNCTFGGLGHRTLYVTARTSVYAAPMQAVGHRFATASKSR